MLLSGSFQALASTDSMCVFLRKRKFLTHLATEESLLRHSQTEELRLMEPGVQLKDSHMHNFF